jgi:hypothetical protein
MNPSELISEEKKIDTWTINYTPPNGGLFNGKLTITDKSLHFLATYNMSLNGFLEANMYIKDGSHGHLIIPKSRIIRIETDKSFFHKKVLVTIDSGQTHTFNYGMLNIDKVVEAISSK